MFLWPPNSVSKIKMPNSLIISENENKCVSWKEKLFSKGRKEILIKVVLTVMAMSCFQFPVTLCVRINTIVANFYWIAWSKLCTFKGEEGLGFRDMKIF